MPSNKHGSKWIRKERRQAIYERDGYLCVWCNQDLSAVDPYLRTLDHLVPRSAAKRSDHTNKNLITACYSCNTERGDRNAIDYAFAKAPNRKAAAALLDRIMLLTGTPIQRALPLDEKDPAKAPRTGPVPPRLVASDPRARRAIGGGLKGV